MRLVVLLCGLLMLSGLAACGGGDAEPAASSDPADAPTPVASSGSQDLVEPCDLLSTEAVAQLLAVDAASVAREAGYNSQREAKNTRDCEWRADGAPFPLSVSYYLRKAGKQAPADAMVRVFETTLANGETVDGDEKVAATAISLQGAAQGLITDEHARKYTKVRGLIWLDSANRLHKLFVTQTADENGNAPPGVSEKTLVGLYEATL